MNRETITENLHRGICTVTFTKVNGESRTMQCTLHPSYLPEQRVLTEDGASPMDDPRGGSDPNLMPVWDTQSNGWRSFKIDTVTDFNTSTLLKG